MNRTRPLLLLLALSLAAPAPAWAAGIAGPKKSALEKLEEGDVIRNRVQLRGGRFEASPAFGFTLNDAFKRNVLLGAQLAYHFSESWAIAATAFTGLSLDTGLAEDIGDKRDVKSDVFSDVGLLASLEVYYTPIAGKFALFGRTVFPYDLHVLLGAGASMVSGNTDVEGASFAPVAGVGFRTFVTDGIAINMEVRDYIYSAALNQVKDDQPGSNETSADASLSNNFAITFGIAFYLPQEPEIGD